MAGSPDESFSIVCRIRTTSGLNPSSILETAAASCSGCAAPFGMIGTTPLSLFWVWKRREPSMAADAAPGRSQMIEGRRADHFHAANLAVLNQERLGYQDARG